MLASRGMTADADWAKLCARVEGMFPGVALDRERFSAYVVRHPAGSAALASDEIEALSELYLAAALRDHHAAAAVHFDARYLEPLGARLSRMGLSAAELDEVKQRTREKLLVGVEGSPLKIEEYAGRGRLAGLVQVVATREALSAFRKTKRERPLDDGELADPVAERWDPGMEMLKGRTREAFREAFEHAVRALEPRERNLLRLHLVGGVTLEQLAKFYSVHRATVVRWLAAARASVLDRTKSELGEKLGFGGSELESVMNDVQSRLDLSVERLLQSRVSLDEAAEPAPGNDEGSQS